MKHNEEIMAFLLRKCEELSEIDEHEFISHYFTLENVTEDDHKDFMREFVKVLSEEEFSEFLALVEARERASLI